jgi:exodeoxyribonuclease VII large subunit
MMGAAVRAKLEKYALTADKYTATLDSLNPRSVLQRGYAIVYNAQGGVVTSSHDPAKDLEIEFSDGRVAVARKDSHGGF